MRADGEPAILKIPDPADDEANGGRILASYEGDGAVRVLEREAHAQLLEYASSASDRTLERMVLAGDDDEATSILCAVIATLHARRTPKASLPLLAFRSRSESLRRLSHPPDGLAAEALAIADEVQAEGSPATVALHGDVHHFNVLRSDARGWLAIDPKGIDGPRAYEYANLLCNPYMHREIVARPRRMRRQMEIVCERAAIDFEETRRLTLLHAMQCWAWSEGADDRPYWLACAQSAASLRR